MVGCSCHGLPHQDGDRPVISGPVAQVRVVEQHVRQCVSIAVGVQVLQQGAQRGWSPGRSSGRPSASTRPLLIPSVASTTLVTSASSSAAIRSAVTSVGSVGGLPSRSRPGSEGDRIRCRLSVAARPTIAKQSPTAATTTTARRRSPTRTCSAARPPDAPARAAASPRPRPSGRRRPAAPRARAAPRPWRSAGRAPARRWPAMTCTVSSTASAAPTALVWRLLDMPSAMVATASGCSDLRRAEGVLAGCAVDQVAVADRGRARASPPHHDGLSASISDPPRSP